MYVYVQVDRFQRPRLRLPVVRLARQRPSLDIRSTTNAKIEARLAQSRRHGLLHATVDDFGYSSVYTRFRRTQPVRGLDAIEARRQRSSVVDVCKGDWRGVYRFLYGA